MAAAPLGLFDPAYCLMCEHRAWLWIGLQVEINRLNKTTTINASTAAPAYEESASGTSL